MHNSGWTRRAALLQLARVGVLLGQDSVPAPVLPASVVRPAHPRLILLDSDLPRLQALVRENGQARKLLAELRREGEKLVNSPSPVLTRLPGEGRRELERVCLFGLLYRLDHETAYLARAVRELTALAESRDANTTHLIETAETTLALAIGYDWFWPELKPEERDLLRQAIVNKGLKTALPFYEKQSGWVTAPGAVNMVANAGMGIAALAVAGEQPELSAAILKFAVDSMARSFSANGPDGAWIDGPGAGSFATYYAVGFLASLETAAGNGHDLAVLRGLERAARYRVYAAGPQGRTFNYGASPEGGGAPEMFWMARRLHQPALAWSEQRELTRRARPEALDLVWYAREAGPPQPPAWPLDAIFASQQRVFFRSSWDDAEAMFLSVKCGENKASHGHLDLGSFVLDAFGVRWATEPERPAGAARPADDRPPNWHNTISIGGENQDAGAEARIISHEFTPALAWVTLDLTRAYPTKVKLWQRRIGLTQRQAVIVEDRVRAHEPVDVAWSMLTDAEITFSGQSALLSKDGALLAVEIETPRHAVFDVTSAGSNKRWLVARLGEKNAEVDLNVVLIAYKAGQPRPKITARFPE